MADLRDELNHEHAPNIDNKHRADVTETIVSTSVITAKTTTMTKVTTNDKLDVPQHRLRNGLESGQLMLGTFSSLATSWAARVVATCGWDVSHS